jgi:REP element-mobilizing transposase RayT
MARRQRFHAPTSTYHVMLRGNDGQPIFFSEEDKSRLCLLMQQGIERFGHSIEAFCFMSNHIHLAVRVADISISRIMQHLSFRYTRYITRSRNYLTSIGFKIMFRAYGTFRCSIITPSHSAKASSPSCRSVFQRQKSNRYLHTIGSEPSIRLQLDKKAF